jgi:predicted kinase
MTLPLSIQLCYKPACMSKWNRDRSRRRKRKPAQQGTPGQQNPAPLQPIFPDPADWAAPVDRSESVQSPPEPEVEEQPESLPQAERPAETQRLRKERSRRRGRRGRGGKRPAEVSRPVLPVEGGMETGEGAEVALDGAAVASEATEAAEPSPGQGAAPQKATKGAVVLAIGLPGSGKSSWFKRHNIIPLSSDLMRTLLFDDVAEQRYQDLVFSSLRALLRSRMIAKRPMNFVDATNLSPKERHSWIKLANDFGYEAHAVFFDVPTEVCMDRNRKRQRNVPEEIMQRMAAKLKPPAFEEGFAKITVVRLKR